MTGAERGSDHGEYSGMVRRTIRAFGRRLGKADPEDLALILDMRAELDDAIATAVMGQRAAGFSWAEIARGIGMSRQAAFQRWGHLEKVEAAS